MLYSHLLAKPQPQHCHFNQAKRQHKGSNNDEDNLAHRGQHTRAVPHNSTPLCHCRQQQSAQAVIHAGHTTPNLNAVKTPSAFQDRVKHTIVHCIPTSAVVHSQNVFQQGRGTSLAYMNMNIIIWYRHTIIDRTMLSSRISMPEHNHYTTTARILC
jgi:hypothetical protein